MRILFMGTSTFGIPVLKRIIKEGRDIVGVVTQPDRKAGRKKKICLPPIKEVVMYDKIPLFQPENVNARESVEKLTALKPDIIVVVSYAQFLKKAIRELPKVAIFNVHASLLPKYRGGAPIHRAIMNGETETGITTFHIEKGMDTGNIILKRKLSILPDENTCDLHDRLAILGAEVASETIDLLERGEAPSIPQNDDEATYAPILRKKDGDIDWTKPASEIINHIRGMNSWPVAFTHLNKEALRIYKAHIVEKNYTGQVGSIVAANRTDGLVVQTGDGLLGLGIVQPKNSKIMRIRDFLNGRQVNVGDIFLPLDSC